MIQADQFSAADLQSGGDDMKDIPYESIDTFADETARGFSDYATHTAFKLFRNRKFRSLAGFATLSQSEQDRIFNELVSAFVTLIMLLLEAPDLHSRREFGDYLDQLKTKIPVALLAMFEEMGIEAEHRLEYSKLIELRYEEYAKDKHEVRKAAMEIESSENRLNVKSLSEIQVLVPVQSVAIGCHHYVCRGETEGKDELFKVLLKELAKFYLFLRIRLEGGRMTLLTRIRAKVMAWFRR
ncbi:MAG TPA: hypothetical protein DCP63_05390 [Bacteroidetes bacterium]|nr:hypothetical protein [Bacteroidota bacterium]